MASISPFIITMSIDLYLSLSAELQAWGQGSLSTLFSNETQTIRAVSVHSKCCVCMHAARVCVRPPDVVSVIFLRFFCSLLYVYQLKVTR